MLPSHADDLGNIMALTNAVGTVVERNDYADYGRPIISSPTGVAWVQSSVGNPYMFTGRRVDPETGWYYFRTRYLDPIIGRFTTRDTIGIWGDPINLGNGSAYVGNNPWSRLDPFGMDWTDHAWAITEGVGKGVAGVAVGVAVFAAAAVAAPVVLPTAVAGAFVASVGVAGAAYGGYQTGLGIYEAATGNAVDALGRQTGQTLDVYQREEVGASSAVGVIAGGAGYKYGPRLAGTFRTLTRGPCPPRPPLRPANVGKAYTQAAWQAIAEGRPLPSPQDFTLGPTGGTYSVAFQTELDSASYPRVS